MIKFSYPLFSQVCSRHPNNYSFYISNKTQVSRLVWYILKVSLLFDHLVKTMHGDTKYVYIIHVLEALNGYNLRKYEKDKV